MRTSVKHISSWLVATGLAVGMVACGAGNGESTTAFKAVNDTPADALGCLGAADDIDPATPGVQVSVTLQAPRGAFVTLEAGDQTYTAQANDERKVSFSAVTLENGQNELRARDETGREATLRVRLAAPSLSLATAESRTVSCTADDRNPAEAGVQTAVVVSTANLPNGTPVIVRIGGDSFSGTALGGQAAVEVTLPALSGEVAMTAEAEVEGQTWSTAGALKVQCAGCHFRRIGTRNGGTADSALVLGQPDDASVMPGLQSHVEVDAAGLPGTEVSLYVAGELVGTAAPNAEGVAAFDGVSLEDEDWIEVECTHPDAAEEASRRQVRVDMTPPPTVNDLDCEHQGMWIQCSWIQPEDPDSPTGLAGWSLRYVFSDTLGASEFSTAIPVPSLPMPSQDGVEMKALFLDPSSDAAVMTFAMQIYDAAGNASALSNAVTLGD